MNRIAKIGWVALLATGILSTAALAAAKPDRQGPTDEPRKAFLEKRLAKLPADEQRLARQLWPLRDSLMRAMGDYHRKVADGAVPRSLTAERNAVASLESQIQRLQTENQEVWLDLLARMPGPGFPRHGMHPGKGGRHEPPPPPDAGEDGPDEDGSSETPPPPPPAP